MVSGSLIIVPDVRAPCKTIRPSGVMVSGSLIIVPDCPFRVGTCCGRPVVEQTQDASNEAVPLAELIESAKRLLSVAKVRAEVLKTCPACPMAEGFRCRKTPPTPHWDRDLCELWVGQFMVLSYDREAPNQHAVLDLYEDEHWSHKIRTPSAGIGRQGNTNGDSGTRSRRSTGGPACLLSISAVMRMSEKSGGNTQCPLNQT